MLPLPLPHLHASAAAVHAVVLGMEGANDVHVSAGICLAGRAPAKVQCKGSVAHTEIFVDREPMMSMSVPASALLDVPLQSQNVTAAWHTRRYYCW
jgi:hypothetical protein